MTIWRMRTECWTPNATNTHSEYVILQFFTAIMVARRHLNVTFYVHCLSCDLNTPLFGKLYRVDGTRMKYMEHWWNDCFFLSFFLS
jgi:hypothetical protein